MILVVLGSFATAFTRPLIEIERLCREGKINEEVIVQAGYTAPCASPWITFREFIDPGELAELNIRARIIITHAGVASLVNAIKLKKKVIAIARLKKYNEHVDDHQTEILKEFAAMGYIIPWGENVSLDEVMESDEKFQPGDFV